MEHILETDSCGKLKIYTNHSRSSTDVVIITCHDLGVNHHEYANFLNNDEMVFLAQKMFWVHVEVPGQGDNEEDLPAEYDFPTLDQLADGIKEVCHKLKITSAVLFGEGAGANILARFAMANDNLVLGALLIHCTGTTSGFMESIKDKLVSYGLTTKGMNPKAESYLLQHRFGTVKENPDEHELRYALSSFKHNLRTSINAKNLNLFIQAYMNRTNILDRIQELKCPVLFMTGCYASHSQDVQKLHNALLNSLKDTPEKRDKVEFICIDEIANPIQERPEKVSESLLYFLQGLGLASGLMTRRMSSVVAQTAMFARRPSMEESDKPIGVENLTYSPDRKYSCAGETMNDEIASFLASREQK